MHSLINLSASLSVPFLPSLLVVLVRHFSLAWFSLSKWNVNWWSESCFAKLSGRMPCGPPADTKRRHLVALGRLLPTANNEKSGIVVLLVYLLWFYNGVYHWIIWVPCWMVWLFSFSPRIQESFSPSLHSHTTPACSYQPAYCIYNTKKQLNAGVRIKTRSAGQPAV